MSVANLPVPPSQKKGLAPPPPPNIAEKPKYRAPAVAEHKDSPIKPLELAVRISDVPPLMLIFVLKSNPVLFKLSTQADGKLEL